MKIIIIALLLCIPACETHHYYEDPYETEYYEPEPIVYTEYIEVVEYVSVSTITYSEYDCWGTVTPFQWSNDQLIYCDAGTCCTWADYNCEVTYCYGTDSCGWTYVEEVCYF
jgi:hypothetical protein